ncbi:MAG: hypothetical protein EPN36_15135 [Rhodanobacteraceae bacterium]|nr:MAG: hypothetical protein EPN36_15135 [Rhodanobacteraceae bacterium]
MRIGLIIVGIVLLGLGVWIATGKPTYPSTETPIKFGQLEVKTTVQKPVPAPIGYAGIVVGGVLILAGALKKK